jgi:glycosyltransferase involved in cell wall biosynthesis
MRTAVGHGGGSGVIIGAAYELADQFCKDAIGVGVGCAYIAERQPVMGEDEGLIAGWWIDRSRGEWIIRRGRGHTLVLLGARRQEMLHGRALLEARIKGLRRILLIDVDGSVIEDIDVADALIKTLDAAPPSTPFGELTYAAAYRDMFDVIGEHLKQPASAFDPDHVLLLTGSLQPGGAERQLSYTACGLANKGRKVTVACNYLDPPRDFFKAAIEEAGVEVVQTAERPAEYDTPFFRDVREVLSRYDMFRLQGGLLWEILIYAQVMGEVGAGTVHTWMDFTNVLGGLGAELVGVPKLVMSGRSVSPAHFPALFQPYMRPGYLSILERRPVLMLNNSNAGARDYEAWLDLPKGVVRVLHNGFTFPKKSLPADRARIRTQFGVAQDALVVGTLTRFSEEKNPRLAVDMARLIHARRPEVRFLFFGAGPDRDALRDLVEQENLEGVILMPGLTQEAWAALAAMDVFVLTSRVEGLANVLIEAQAAGLPVVCTGVGGMPETYLEQKTGFGVGAATAEALAERVIDLLDDDPTRRQMGLAAARHVRKMFGIDHMIEQSMDAYAHAPGHASGPNEASP